MQKIFKSIQSMINIRKSKTKLVVSVISILILAFLALPLSAKNRNNNNNNQNGNEDNVRVFTSFLTGGQESPENNSTAFGVAFMTFNESTRMLSYSISYTDDRLSSAENAAHFHGPAAPGENASILFDLLPGNPKVGSVGPLNRRQQRQLRQGLLYINIHTDSFPDGEIRGQVLPAARIRAGATPTGTPTPEATPEETPEITPEETPEITPEETPEITPEITPVVTP
jgi:hypothetical protein